MIGLFKGMATTFSHLFRPTFNQGYPGVPKVLPERSRSHFAVMLEDDSSPNCKACGLCERNCPTGAIGIQSSKVEGVAGRVLDRFEIDLGKCMYCGICVERCPSLGITQTGEFSLATPDKAMTIAVLYQRDMSVPLPGAQSQGSGEEATA